VQDSAFGIYPPAVGKNAATPGFVQTLQSVNITTTLRQTSLFLIVDGHLPPVVIQSAAKNLKLPFEMPPEISRLARNETFMIWWKCPDVPVANSRRRQSVLSRH
jgi:hypothetical protein